jgi:hypothetical protein
VSGLIKTKTTGPFIRFETQTPSGIYSNDTDWNQASGMLTLKPNMIVRAGVDVCVSFIVRNPAKAQSAPALSITADILLHTASAISSGSTLLVEANVFTANVTQSTPFPCMSNVVTVTLTSVVPMYSFCTNLVTVTGLCGSTTDDSTALAITATGGVFTNDSFTGVWTRESGVLVIDLQSFILAAKSDLGGLNMVTLAVKLMNQECGQAGCQTSAVAVLGSTGLASDDDETNWTSTVTLGTGASRPMFIEAAHLEVTLVQGGLHVCIASELNIFFRSNVPLQRRCVSNVTIYGLSWYEDPNNYEMTPNALIPYTNNPFAFDNSALWIPANRTLGPGLTMKIGEGVEANTDYKIKFPGTTTAGLKSKLYTGDIAVGLAVPASTSCLNLTIVANVSFEEKSTNKAILTITSTSQQTVSLCAYAYIFTHT